MKPIQRDDIARIRNVTNMKMNPAKDHLSFTLITPDQENNAYKQDIYVTDCKTDETKRMTGTGKDSWSLWDDDETLLLMSERSEEDKAKDFEEKTVFYRLNIHGGEAVKAFEVNKNVMEAKKVADGRYVFSVLYDRNMPEKAEERKEEADYHIFDEIPFWGNGRGYISGKRTVLYLYDEKENELKQLTDADTDCGYFFIQNEKLLFIAVTWRDVLPLTTGLYEYDLSSDSVKTVIDDDKMYVSYARYAGKDIVFAATDGKIWGEGQLDDLWILKDGEETYTLLHQNTEELAYGSTPMTDCLRPGGTIFKGKEDGTLLFMAMKGHESAVYTWKDGAVSKTVSLKDGAIACFEENENDFWYIGAEVNALNAVYHNDKKIFDPNEELMKDRQIPEIRSLSFQNRQGETVEGWVLLPADFDPEKKYPGILSIHGGPRAAYGMIFSHEQQLWAANGYFSFYCNPHGSQGYGEAFADLRGKYGTVDFDDLMDFTDLVLKEYPNIDETRLGASGGSYGGFMCNWIEGHTDRFGAIASQRSVSNWVADFGTSEIGFSFDRNEMGATPWTDMEKMWDQSPLKAADQAKTPILFIHSLRDYNCFIDQGAQMFTAMKHFGVPSRMVVFEEENHGLCRNGKPKHRIRRLKEIGDWFDKYLK